jgi:hypothetical protein
MADSASLARATTARASAKWRALQGLRWAGPWFVLPSLAC